MAASAAKGKTAKPRHLRIVEGAGTNKDGVPLDSGRRPIAEGVKFDRRAPENPGNLSPDAQWLWDQVTEQMETKGLLKPIDGASLEVMCETFARWREAKRFRQEHALLAKNSQGTTAAPWIGIEERASREFRAWCAEYGITPAAENNLRAAGETPDADENPY